MITFVTHLRYDHDDRIDNLNAIIEYYSTNVLNCEFIFVEDDKEHNKAFDKIKFIKGKTKFLFVKNEHTYYRTRALNIGIKQAKGDVVVSMDTDCLVKTEAIHRCYKALTTDEIVSTIAWPYNGYFIDIGGSTRSKILNSIYTFDDIIKSLDGKLNLPLAYTYKDFHIRCTDNDHLGTGGFVMFNKQKFLETGGYNENFIGWGCEDNELKDRLAILGHSFFRYTSPEAICFHLFHRSAQRAENPFFDHNSKEWHKVKEMNRQQLQDYIKTWRWNNDNI
jgi:predicted glycosyltransferase involved in capsule biosynthesis